MILAIAADVERVENLLYRLRLSIGRIRARFSHGGAEPAAVTQAPAAWSDSLREGHEEAARPFPAHGAIEEV